MLQGVRVDHAVRDGARFEGAPVGRAAGAGPGVPPRAGHETPRVEPRRLVAMPDDMGRDARLHAHGLRASMGVAIGAVVRPRRGVGRTIAGPVGVDEADASFVLEAILADDPTGSRLRPARRAARRGARHAGGIVGEPVVGGRSHRAERGPTVRVERTTGPARLRRRLHRRPPGNGPRHSPPRRGRRCAPDASVRALGLTHAEFGHRGLPRERSLRGEAASWRRIPMEVPEAAGRATWPSSRTWSRPGRSRRGRRDLRAGRRRTGHRRAPSPIAQPADRVRRRYRRVVLSRRAGDAPPRVRDARPRRAEHGGGTRVMIARAKAGRAGSGPWSRRSTDGLGGNDGPGGNMVGAPRSSPSGATKGKDVLGRRPSRGGLAHIGDGSPSGAVPAAVLPIRRGSGATSTRLPGGRTARRRTPAGRSPERASPRTPSAP